MRDVFEVELYSENSRTELTLPAAPYALLDALSKLELAEGERPGWEILKTPSCHHIYPYLDPAGGTLPELNALTQRLSELGETELSIVEGLIQMEQPRPGITSVPLPRLIDFAYSTDCCHLVEEATNDYTLGRFCAENGFIPGAEGLSDEAFALLNFGKIGREFCQAEGGVFTRGGYVQRREELKQVYKTLNLTLKKPDYTLLAETASGVQVKLPVPIGTTVADEPAQCLDCAAPSLTGLTATMSTLDMLARRLAELELDGELTKYKAVLEAIGCDDMGRALTLADKLDQYTFSPKLLGPEDVAIECLKTMLPDDEVNRLTPYLDIRRYGEAVMEQSGGKLTGYGLVERVDGDLAPGMEEEPGKNEMVLGI